jgi:hypothetical protein
MAQKRFHVGVPYSLHGRGEDEARAALEFVDRYKHATIERFRDDRVLLFWLKWSSQERFRRDVTYEISGPGGLKTPVKYVAPLTIGNRTAVVFRLRRVRARIAS